MIITKLNNYIFFLISSLFCLIIPALVSGPFLPDLFLSLIAIYGLSIMIIKKNYNILKHPFFIIFIFFYIYIFVNSLFSENIKNSLSSSIFYIRYLFFIIGGIYLLEKNIKLIKYFLFIFSLTFIFVSFDALYQLFYDFNLIGLEKQGDRLSGMFGEDELILGSFLSRLFPLLIGIFIFIYKKPKNLIFYFLFLIFLTIIDVLVFFSGERTAFFYITLSTILMIFLLSNFKILRIISLVLSFLIIISYGFYDNQMNNRMFTQTINDFGLNNLNEENLKLEINENRDNRKINAFSPKHEAMFITSFNIFKDNIIFGKGPNSFEILCSDERFSVPNGCSTSPHNNFIQLLAETGLVGFTIVFFLFIYVTYVLTNHLYKKIFNKPGKLKDHEICFYICIFISLFPLVPTSNFFNNWLNVIYFLPLIFIIKPKLYDNK